LGTSWTPKRRRPLEARSYRFSVTRRGLQIALAALWLLDAALQFQPYMFSSAFAANVIGPAGDGQAGFVSGPVDWSARLIGAHPLVWNTPFALLQLALGLGLLWRRTARAALGCSILWSLLVWYFGEALGGVTGVGGSLLSGWPGAALLYAVLGAAAWPSRRSQSSRGAGEQDRYPPSWLLPVWTAYWVGGSILQLWRGPSRGPDLAARIAEAANGAPGWLARTDFGLATHLGRLGQAGVVYLIVGQAVIGLASLARPPWRTAAIVVGAGVAFGYWAVGQTFGALTSGHATDPNIGPLVVVLAIATLSARGAGFGGVVRRATVERPTARLATGADRWRRSVDVRHDGRRGAMRDA
jgi:hypothetical protein